ncbi:MAG: hypothetical protein ACI9QN_001163 [Arcticibacterium sp.]|jgi:hypothetical protein
MMIQDKTMIHIQHEIKSTEWKLHGSTLDSLEKNNTLNQMKVHYCLLENFTQSEMSKNIDIIQSSVNRRIKKLGWDLVKNIISHSNKTL